MPTTSTRTRKSTAKKNVPMAQKVLASLEKVAPQAKRITALSPEKLSEQLGIQSKDSTEKRAILKCIEEVSRSLDILRQAFVTDESNIWAEQTRHKAVENLKRFVNKGTLIKAEELMDQLGWTRQALSKARKARRIFSVEIKGDCYYPGFFADPQYDRRQLEAVSKALGDLPGTSKLQFMLTPKGSLNSLTPLKALARGKVIEVKIAAEGFAER